jgi:type II secretory pathway pseudopilin PulG
MTLIEVVVALGLFAVMSTAALSVLGSAITLTRDDKARLEAVNLATRELEITRDTFSAVTRGPDRVATNAVTNPSPLPGGAVGAPLVVNGVPYTVVRTAQWAPVNSAAASTCDEGTTSELAYLHVKVQVSWPELGDRRPVTMDTVMTPPKGTYSALAGHIGLKVIDGEGRPRSGVQVTASAASGTYTGTTGTDGCALLAFLTAGSYAVTVSAPGFVNPKGDPTGSVTAQVQAGQLWRGSIEYDLATSLSVFFQTADGYPVPPDTGIALTLGNSALQPVGTRAVPGTGDHRTIPHLWPYPSGYQVWAGSCQDADPQFTGGQRDLPVTHADWPVALGALEVNGAANQPVVAKHAADGLCTSGETLQLGTTGAGGMLRTSLPYGTWSIWIGTSYTDVTIAQDDLAPPTVSVP